MLGCRSPMSILLASGRYIIVIVILYSCIYLYVKEGRPPGPAPPLSESQSHSLFHPYRYSVLQCVNPFLVQYSVRKTSTLRAPRSILAQTTPDFFVRTT